MPNLNVNILGRDGNTRAKVTGQEELLVSIGSFGPSVSGLATESTLKDVLAAVDNMRDYEVRLVVDSTPVTPVTWLEVRYWDAQSGALGTPEYYLPGSTTPGSPVLPISYINNQTLLSQILAELTTIDTNTFNTVTELTDVNLTLASILADTTTISNIDFATETTLALIEDVIDNMTFTGNDLNVSLPTGTNTSFYNRMLGAPLVVPAGAISVSVQNIGNNNITILTDSSPATVIDRGISLSFDAQEGKTLGAYTFTNSTGTSLYIVTQVR